MSTVETTAADEARQREAGFQVERSVLSSMATILLDQARQAQDQVPDDTRILHISPSDPSVPMHLHRAAFRTEDADIQVSAWRFYGQAFNPDRTTIDLGIRLLGPQQETARRLSRESGYLDFPIVYHTVHRFQTAKDPKGALALGAVGKWTTMFETVLKYGLPVQQLAGELQPLSDLNSLQDRLLNAVPVPLTPDTNDQVAAARWFQQRREEHPVTVTDSLKARRAAYRAQAAADLAQRTAESRAAKAASILRTLGFTDANQAERAVLIVDANDPRVDEYRAAIEAVEWAKTAPL